MNIFMIPSWYPCEKYPQAGIFASDQARALGQKTKHTVILSLWGQNAYKIPITNPFLSLRIIRNFLESKPYIKKVSVKTYEIFNPAISWHYLLFGGNFEALFKVNERNFLEAERKIGRIDLIHSHVSFPAGLIALKLAQKYQRPYIVNEHMGPFPFKFFLKKGKIDIVISEPLIKADKVIAVSPSLAHQIKKLVNIDIENIPNFIDEDFFKPVAVKKKQFFTFFTLGTLGFEKGTKDLLESIHLAVKTNPNLRFRIGGAGNNFFYRIMAKRLGIENYIQWLGSIPRSTALKEFQNCDAFLLPSRHESFGLVLVEAMACGKPIISTRCGGPESIITKQTGIIKNVGDIIAISQAILFLSKNSNRFSQNVIRQEFLDKFSKKVVIERINDCYNKVIKNAKYLATK